MSQDGREYWRTWLRWDRGRSYVYTGLFVPASHVKRRYIYRISVRKPVELIGKKAHLASWNTLIKLRKLDGRAERAGRCPCTVQLAESCKCISQELEHMLTSLVLRDMSER